MRLVFALVALAALACTKPREDVVPPDVVPEAERAHVDVPVPLAEPRPTRLPFGGEGEGEGEGEPRFTIPEGAAECVADSGCAAGACATNTCGSVCTAPVVEGELCAIRNNGNPCAGFTIACAAGLECVGVDVIDLERVSRCIVPAPFGASCPDSTDNATERDGCVDGLVCEYERCTGANFLGPCDPAGVVVDARCPEGQTCVTVAFSDEGPPAITSCQSPPCLGDQIDDDGCSPEQACVVFGCSRSLICSNPGVNPNCQDGGEGEGEPDVGGPAGVVCVDDDDCNGGVCGAYHRCFHSSCASDADCGSEGCATASLQGNTCGSSCAPFVDAGGPCRFVSTSGCDNFLPCAPGLACDAATGTCL